MFIDKIVKWGIDTATTPVCDQWTVTCITR